MVVTVNKWGHSIGLRIPKAIAKNNNIEEGTQLEIIKTKEGLLLKKTSPALSIEAILASISDSYDDEELLPDMLATEEW